MAKKYDLRILSGVVIDGEILAPGAVAEGVDEKLARDLLARGKVVLASIDDGADPAENDGSVSAAAKPAKPAKAAKAAPADALASGAEPEPDAGEDDSEPDAS